MSFIAPNRAIATALLALVSGIAPAKEGPPRFLREPVLGLRLETAGVKLDPLPEDERAKCEQVADNENITGRLWIFARANDAGAVYYVVSGYFKRRYPEPGQPLYDLDERGGVLKIMGNECVTDGPAREVFDVRDVRETPPPILQRLADDLAIRLVRAFGGADRLRTAIRNERIDPDPLPQELHNAFDPYFVAPGSQ